MGMTSPRQDSEPPVFQEDTFIKAAETGVFHGFFGRAGGMSGGVYDSLNCGLGSDDAPENVAENRARVARVCGVAPDHMLSLYQVHGKECLYVDKAWALDETRPQADAFVTDQPGFGLGILSADCAPVLFYGAKADGAPVIGAAHAGWKGALGGVLEETAGAMEKLGAVRDSLRACVGPCIGRASYEVGADFIEPFLEENDESVRFIRPAGKAGHAMFDLPGYAAWRLFRAGVRRIAIMDRDTYVQEAAFFSYRRATHRGEKDYARQISVIAIQPKDEILRP